MRRLIFALLVVGLAAGCGGGALQSVTPGGGAPQRGPLTNPGPTPSPTLYVASKDRINAFNPSDTGATPPTRTFYVHANQADGIAGIATYTDGSVDVLQNYFPVSDNLSHCRVVIESATASGDAAALNPKIDCPGNNDPTTGYGIGRNPVVGGFDILFYDANTGFEYVKRYTQTAGTGSAAYYNYLTLPSTTFRYLATDRGGHDYVDDTTGHVRKYKYSAQDPSPPTAQYFTVGTSSGALAVSPVDLTLYVVLPGAGPSGGDKIAGYDPTQYTGANGASVAPAYVQDFVVGTTVTALATDQNGYLYVGVTTSNGARVKTFNPHFAGGAPIRNLDALPGDPSNKITGLALYP